MKRKNKSQIAKIIRETVVNFSKKHNQEVNEEEILKQIEYYQHANTKGQKRFRLYFEEITRKEKFKNEVSRIRKIYNIPPEGYPFEDKDGKENYPERKLKGGRLKKYKTEIIKLSKDHGLLTHYWNEVVSEYVWNNSNKGLFRFFMNLDKCYIEYPHGLDFEIHKLFNPKKQFKLNKQEQEKINKMYPVILRISPYASTQEIKDYIDKYSEDIKNSQKEYQKEKFMRILEIRPNKASNNAIKDFIYEHQDLPIKKIATKLYKELEKSLDHGHIGKILSMERKKRNN